MAFSFWAHLQIAFFFSVFSFEKGSPGQAAKKGISDVKINYSLKQDVMEIITGRITADATVNTTKQGKQVVNFSIAINDGYKPKDGEFQVITTYVNCSYWLTTKAAQRLRKGVVVQLYGRIGMNVYTNQQGEATGSLTLHVSDFKTHTAVPAESNPAALSQLASTVVRQPAPVEDLPF